MKTKFLTLLFILLGVSMKAQMNQESLDSLKQTINIHVTRLKSIESLLKSEQKILDASKNDSGITKVIVANISKYATKRDSIIKKIEKIKENAISNLTIKSVALKNSLSRLKLVADNVQTSEQKTEKKAIEDKLAIIKDNNSKIMDIASKDTASKDLNAPFANNEARYMYMNGFNFDINSIDKLKYVGHFNIYIPATKNNCLGINTGLLKVNYLNNDSIVEQRTDKVLVNPLDNLAVGSSYNKQYNRYSKINEAASYSAYFQVLCRIFKKGTATLYLHEHNELLISKYTTTTKIKTISEVLTPITLSSEIPTQAEVIPLLTKGSVENNIFYSGYFGLGLTLDFNFLDNCSLFMQTTTGGAMKHPYSNTEIGKNGVSTIEVDSNVKLFFLTRSYFKYYISNASELVVGTDIRHQAGQSPFVSIYAGLNLGIDKIADLFK